MPSYTTSAKQNHLEDFFFSFPCKTISDNRNVECRRQHGLFFLCLPPQSKICPLPIEYSQEIQDVLSAEANSILFSSTYTSPTPSGICCWIAGTGSQRLGSRPPLTSCIYKLLSEIVRTKQSADNVSGVVSGSLSGKTCRGVEVIVSWSHGGASSTEVLIDVPFRKDVSGEESAMTSESDSSSQSALPIAGRENIGDVTPGKGLSGLI